MRANDGTGNISTYINSNGGAAPVTESEGYALRTRYNPYEGRFDVRTSDSYQTAGAPITWQNIVSLWPDGRVGVQQLCDENGQNCTDVSGGGLSGGGATPTSIMGEIGSTGQYWPDIITCNTSVSSAVVGPLLYVAGGTYGNVVAYKFSDNMVNSGDEKALQFNKSDGSFRRNESLDSSCSLPNIQNFISLGQAYYFSSGWSQQTSFYFDSVSEITNIVANATGLNANGAAVRANQAEADAFCAIAAPGTTATSFSNAGRWHSPGDNYTFLYARTSLFLNNRGWRRVGARNYNSKLDNVLCE